jgi:hypothetical protein
VEFQAASEYRWSGLRVILRRAWRPHGFTSQRELAADLGVDPETLRRFANGCRLEPAWLPLALAAYVQRVVRDASPQRAAHFLHPLADLLQEVEIRRREDRDYARQWAADRASMPPELECLALLRSG